ncbi:hypothetical protein SFUMM280S_10783 [Streptomyces fumanus]
MSVVGKMAGKGRPVPVELFRRNHPRATLANAPLIDSLTPHKMVRREFLDRIAMRLRRGRAGRAAAPRDAACTAHYDRCAAGRTGGPGGR